TMTITRFGMTPEAIKELVNRRVEEVLAAHEATRAANALAAENQSQIRSDDDNKNCGNGNDENGNGNPNDNVRVHYMLEVRIDRITKIETTQRQLEASQLGASGEQASLVERIGSLRLEYLKVRAMLSIETERFQELTMLCTKMVPEEEDQIERYVGANSLMDQKLKGYAVKNVENKRRLENVARACTAGNNERKPYNGLLPLCNKCKLHHEGTCTVRCGKCNKVGHLTQDCKVINSTTSTQRGQVVNQRVVTCYECGRQGHYRSDCPKLKDQNRGNKARNKNGVGKARGKTYVLGGGDANPNSNVVRGTFLLNNHYASMIFDSGADRSFVSTTFSDLLDITPDTLDVSYVVELADGRISKTNTILRGCTLGLLGHPFNIDPMPVELGSFDIIIGMDWLPNNHAVIVCDKRIV
nr:reverse transcriptase domain-containing protein [Tanacetum cinerariifolium]